MEKVKEFRKFERVKFTDEWVMLSGQFLLTKEE
jgi:hypothetical protein